MKVTVKHSDRGCGSHTTIVEEPYASALANIDGLATARDNATYKGVRFGRDLQQKLTIYFMPHIESWQTGVETFAESFAAWCPIRDAGGGVMDIRDEKLAEIIAASAAIDAVIANAKPAAPTYPCACHADGCRARVSVEGAMCRTCDFDENDN